MELALSNLGVGVMAFLLYPEHSAFRGKAALVIATVIFGWGLPSGTSTRWWRTTTTP